MGVSTDAILFYGFLVDNENSEESNCVVEDYSDRERFEDSEINSDKNCIDRLQEKCKDSVVRIDYHCCSAEKMYFVYHKDYYRKAWRGDPAIMSGDFFDVTMEDKEELLRACKDIFDWNIEHEILGWKLVSYTDLY